MRRMQEQETVINREEPGEENREKWNKEFSLEENIARIFSPFDEAALHPETLKADLDKERHAKFPDASILSEEPKEFSVEKETENLPDTRFYTQIGSARIEGFFHRGNIPALYVMFDGSRTRKGGKALAPLPSFSRWSWYKDTNASLVSLEDPMYYTFSECTLGWYYGTKDEDYRQYCAQCIGRIAELLHIKNADIVLYGSSGGGTAAIGVSRYLPGCSVVAINPQLLLEKYPYSEDLERIIGIGIREASDLFIRNDNSRIIRENPESMYFLIENVRSDADYVTQFQNFFELSGISPGFGIEKNGNIVTWLYDAQGAPSVHSAVENTAVFKMIDLLVRCVRADGDVHKLKNLFYVINEFWYERYSLMRTNYYQKKKVEELETDNARMKNEIEGMKKDLEWGWIKVGVKAKRLFGKVKRNVQNYGTFKKK